MSTSVPTEMPAYIQLRYSENGVFSKLQSQVANVTGVVRRDFEDMSGSIEASISRALGSQRNAFGSLDLGLDQMRQAIKAQDMLANAAEETARAARRAAQAQGDQSTELLRAADAAEALAAKERAAATAALLHADAIEQVQVELNREASASATVIGTGRRLAASNDNVRYASLGATQQLQDMAVSLYGGQRAGTVMAQQLPQLAFALSSLEGSTNKSLDRLGRFATFMSGPWGLMIGLGVGVLATLASELLETEKAAKAAEIGSSGLANAQSVLGEMFDLASGKIEHQNELLTLNARLTALNLRSEAMQQRQSAKDAFGNFGQGSLGLSWMQKGAGALGLPVYLTGSTDREQAVRALTSDLQSGKITREQALAKSDKLDFSGLAITKQQYQQALIDQVAADMKEQTAGLIDQSLDSGTLAKGLRRDRKPKKDNSTEKAAREAERLAKFGNSASEAITRLNEKFDQSPKLIDQAAQATRQLDDIITDLSKRKPIGFQQMIAEAQATKAVISDSLLRPLQDMEEASARQFKMQELNLRGRDAEAAALQAIWSLEDKLGSEEALRAKVANLIAAGRKDEAAAFQQILDKYPEMKRRAAEIAETEVRRTREIERQRLLLQAQLDVIDTARNSLTDLLSGRSTNFFKDVGQSLKDLQGKRLVDQLFGDTFRDLENELRGQSPLGKESQRLATEMNVATKAFDGLVDAVNGASKAFGGSSGPLVSAANDNPISGFDNAQYRQAILDAQITGTGLGSGLATGENEILVTGKRPFEFSTKSMTDLAGKLSKAITDPFTEILSKTFGTSFGQMLGGIMQQSLSGYMTGGAAGGIVGGLKGIVDQTGIFGGSSGKLSGKLGGAMDGAATGTMAAGIMKSLGLKTSTTGAQIGGAVGSFLGPVGSIVGSVAGGLLGGLFKKTKWGRVDLTSAGASSAFGNSGSSKEGAVAAGGSFTEGLQNIIDQLGGTMGDFGSISLGVRHGDWRVNTSGTSLKIKNGAKEFDDDQEAAIKYAIMTAIDRGAVQDIRASTKRLLQAGDDLDEALQDALDWENVFKELKSYKDPIGAALDDLDTEFEKLIDLSKEAGASAEEMAQLEELYGIKRNEIIEEQNEKLIGTLKDLYDSLTTGDNGLSLRDRESAALGTYNDLAARVAAGDTTAYDDYADAAQTLLDIERQLYGSQQEYFDRLNEVIDLTKNRIDTETNVVSIAENRDSPFDSTGAVTSSIDNQTDTLSSQLDAVNTNLGTISSQLASTTGGVSWVARVKFANSF